MDGFFKAALSERVELAEKIVQYFYQNKDGCIHVEDVGEECESTTVRCLSVIHEFIDQGLLKDHGLGFYSITTEGVHQIRMRQR